jgi:hypothetical protein
LEWGVDNGDDDSAPVPLLATALPLSPSMLPALPPLLLLPVFYVSLDSHNGTSTDGDEDGRREAGRRMSGGAGGGGWEEGEWKGQGRNGGRRQESRRGGGGGGRVAAWPACLASALRGLAAVFSRACRPPPS